jgi:hypothetical protein
MNVKYIAIAIVVVIGGMIATGNMGGAKNATGNYIKVRQSAGSSSGEARPSPLAQMIEYNKTKNK